MSTVIIPHNHFDLVSSSFLLDFYGGMLTCLNVSLEGFIAAGICLCNDFVLLVLKLLYLCFHTKTKNGCHGRENEEALGRKCIVLLSG